MTETIVVGAGPAGLAVGACLRRAGRDVVILERAAALGSSWRNHYERLHLHTTRRGSALPYRPFPSDWPRYPSRAQVVEYLDEYARSFELAPKLGEAVTRARRDGDGWHVETSGGAYDAKNLVIASGYNARPMRPEFLGEPQFRGTIVHSSEYRNAEPYRGRRVLVVGSGNTGAEIALDLCEQGAAVVDLCVRGPIHIVRRDMFGIPAQTLALWCRWIPRAILDVMFGWLARLTVGNLSRYGITRPRVRILAQLEDQGRIPMLDIGTVAKIEAGQIRVRPQISEFTGDGVTFKGREHVTYDSVILATGYRPALDYIEGASEVLDERGYPRTVVSPGLYFIGYRNVATGLLREIAREAKRVASAISSR
jgi:thioredoxin reductase